MSIVTVEFSGVIVFTEVTIPNGVTITNNSTLEVATIDSVTGSGSILVEYDVTWVGIPQVGENIVWAYDGAGDYADNEATPMTVAALDLINCTG